MSNAQNPLYLVDISSFIFRAFFAIRSLTSPKGVPSNAVYGVATMLERLISEAKPENLVVIYDSKEPSFREEMYADYKANRSDPPPDLVPQFDLISELVERLGIHSYRKNGFEADDIIATLAKQWTSKSKSRRVVIVTGDKDLMQLVNPQVSVWDTMNDKRYERSQVEEKFGLPPESILDYLALVGDSVDNIPGVEGIGPKTAVQLLKEYGDLDGVLKAAKAGKISGKKGETIAASEKIALLSRELARLKEDVPLDLQEDFFRFEWKVEDELVAFLQEMGFKTLIAKWGGQRSHGFSPDRPQQSPHAQQNTETLKAPKLTLLNDEQRFLALLERIQKTKRFAFDLETTSLNPRAAEIVGFAIAVEDDEAFYVPVGHRLAGLGIDTQGKMKPQLSREWVLQKLKPFLEDPRYGKIGQNLKYDFSVLLAHGVAAEGVEADTMVAAYVVDSSGSHGMDALAQKYLDYTPVSYEEVCGKGKDQITFDLVDIDAACRYSAEDAWVAWHLWKRLKPELEKLGLMEVFAKIDNPLVEVLTRMECEGVRVDEKWLKRLSQTFDGELAKIEERIQSFAPAPVNLNSPKQLGPFLFDHLKLPPQGKTKTGYSTDADTLEKLAPLHEVPRLLLEYREISKLKGTYVEPLPSLVDPKTHKIHAGFHQAVTATGRLSSSDPNLQNIPIRSERGKMIRRAFIASPGNKLISADYSQVELRILAHMSADPDLSRSFQIEEDVHRRTASEIFKVKLEEVNPEQRAAAKAINFGLMYGKSAFALAEELSISRTEAKDIIDRYFARYKKVKDFLDGLIVEAREKGEAKTLSGRRRKLPDIKANNPAVRGAAERMAMNTPIQGTAADIMKIAMIEVDRRTREGKLKGRMTIQVHDELVLDVPEGEVATMSKLVCDCMENAMRLSVPLKVNLGVADNWQDA